MFHGGPPPAGFDAAAPRYDADEGDNPILGHMRARAAVHFERHFRAGMRLLELGSGTGTEASRLASRGVRVALLDPSPRLLALASEKVERAAPGALVGAHGLRGRDVGRLVASYGEGGLDGAYSSFGPLNCEPDLTPVFDGLARLLPPGAPLVLSVINRYCPTESAWYGLHGQWGEMVRRWGGGPVWASAWPGGPKDVQTYYPSLGQVTRLLRPTFRRVHAEALPLLVPPPYLDFLWRRHPNVFRSLEPVERRLAVLPGLRHLGDHFLGVWIRR